MKLEAIRSMTEHAARDIYESAPSGQILPKRIRLTRDIALIGTRRWCGWLNDPEVREHLESTGAWTDQRLRGWAVRLKYPRTRLYAIVVDGVPVGTIKLDGVRKHRWASVGLMIGEKAYWGRGIGAAVINRACRIAHRAGCVGIWAGIRQANVGSWRAFNKVGFHQVATIGGGKRDWWAAPGCIPFEVEDLMDITKHWPDEPTRIVVMKRLHA